METLPEQFDRQGYVRLEQFFDPEAVEGAREALRILVDREADRLTTSGKITDPMNDLPFEHRLAALYRDCPEEAPKQFRPELHLAGLHPLFFHPGLLDLVESFLGPEIRLYPNYTARPKLPDHAATEVLWHQDGGYTGEGAEALRMVNLWTPLVPANRENGCMEFIPDTHRLGPVRHVQKPHYLEIAAETLAPRLPDAVPIPMEPGDLVLFHNLLFHRGLPNRSTGVRWSLDWRYQDATQPTLRRETGRLARSRNHPEDVVRDAEDWASRFFQ